jgi:Ca-activated chloride channel family protein
MKFTAQLDVDVVALESEDEVTCLVSLAAPVPEEIADRPGETLIAVVDRSGSMSRGPIQAVRTALHQLVDRLKPQDRFGVVVFDDEALVQVPTRAMADHDSTTVHALIEGITPRGSTDLSTGYLLGLSEARRHATETGASVLLLSDGHANKGMTDPTQLGSVAAKARAEGITTTTIGIGQGYDEVLLAEVATQGSGSHRFAFTDDDAIAVVSEEAGDLLSKSILNAVARIRPSDPAMVDRIGTLHDVPRWIEADADGLKHLVVPLGDLYAGEERQLLLHFPVPALASLGLHELAQIAIEYVAMPDLLQQVVAWPVMVNVVPGDEAAGRVPNPTVTSARLLAETTKVKREASQALYEGDIDKAVGLMQSQSQSVSDFLVGIDDSSPETAPIRERLTEEAEQLHRLATGAQERDRMLAMKSMAEDISLQSRGRDDKERRTRGRSKRDF